MVAADFVPFVDHVVELGDVAVVFFVALCRILALLTLYVFGLDLVKSFLSVLVLEITMVVLVVATLVCAWML